MSDFFRNTNGFAQMMREALREFTLKNLKKILNECVAKEWLDKNPFANSKVKHIDPEVPHLSQHELALLEAKELN